MCRVGAERAIPASSASVTAARSTRSLFGGINATPWIVAAVRTGVSLVPVVKRHNTGLPFDPGR
jgi:hypothetical protein